MKIQIDAFSRNTICSREWGKPLLITMVVIAALVAMFVIAILSYFIGKLRKWTNILNRTKEMAEKLNSDNAKIKKEDTRVRIDN